MANFDLIKQLNQIYGKSSPIRSSWGLKNLSESFDPDRIEKALTNEIATLGPDYSRYFDFGLDAEVALLFIDVCNFSERYQGQDGEAIGEYFDEYYNLIIPLIYQYHGEIDKIIGDGVIAVFGPPFGANDLVTNMDRANRCAKDIIRTTIGSDFTSKVAFHAGSINYFKNKSGFYHEFTMIGPPLTELFRLESISQDECINYFANTPIQDFYSRKIMSKLSVTPTTWNHSVNNIATPKGTRYTQICHAHYLRR